MRYEVGDKVVMRSDLDSGVYYGDLKYSRYMEGHVGDVVEVVAVDRSDHTYRTEHWFWLNDRMINHRKTEALSGSRLRYKVGDKVVLREGIDSDRTYEGLYPTSAYRDNRGKAVTIRSINRSGITPVYDIEEVKGSGWITESLIDHPASQRLIIADKQQKENNNNMRFKVGDRVKFVQGLEEQRMYGPLTFSGYLEDPVLIIGEVGSKDNTYRVEQGSWGRWVSAEIVEAVEELAVMPQWFDTWFKTFSDTDFGKGKAIYHLSRVGWGHALDDGYDNEVEFPNGRRWSSNYVDIGNGSKSKGLLLLVDAVINGYEVEKAVEEEPLYYVQFVEGSRNSYLNKDHDDGTYNTMDKAQMGSYQTKFTEAEIKEINPTYWAFAVPVEEMEK